MEDEIVEAVRVISDQITSVSVVLVLMSSAGGLLQGHGISCWRFVAGTWYFLLEVCCRNMVFPAGGLLQGHGISCWRFLQGHGISCWRFVAGTWHFLLCYMLLLLTTNGCSEPG